MFLARTVTHASLAETMRRIDSREFQLWWEAYNRQPWGEYRDGLHAAVVAKTFVDLHCPSHRLRLSDFVLRFSEEPTDEREMERRLMGWARLHNRRIARQRENEVWPQRSDA